MQKAARRKKAALKLAENEVSPPANPEPPAGSSEFTKMKNAVGTFTPTRNPGVNAFGTDSGWRNDFGETLRGRYNSNHMLMNSEILALFDSSQDTSDVGQLIEFGVLNCNLFNSVNWATVFNCLERSALKYHYDVAREEKDFNKLLTMFLSALQSTNTDTHNPDTHNPLKFWSITSLSSLCSSFTRLSLPLNQIHPFFTFLNFNASYYLTHPKTKPSHISNISWAMGKTLPPYDRTDSRQAPSLFLSGIQKHRLEDYIFYGRKTPGSPLILGGTPQEISNLFHAFARLNVKSNRLFSYLNVKAGTLVLEGQGQHVSNLMWSCAKQRYRGAREFFKVVDENNTVIVDEQSTRTISQAAWACGILKYDCPELAAKIDASAPFLVANCSPQELSTLLFGLSTRLRYNLSNLHAEIKKDSDWIVQSGNAHSISNIAKAVANHGESPNLMKTLVESAVPYFVEKASLQTPQLCDVMFALSAFSSTSFRENFHSGIDPLMSSVLVTQHRANSQRPKILSKQNLHYIHLIHLLANSANLRLSSCPDEATKKLLADASQSIVERDFDPDTLFGFSPQALKSFLDDNGFAIITKTSGLNDIHNNLDYLYKPKPPSPLSSPDALRSGPAIPYELTQAINEEKKIALQFSTRGEYENLLVPVGRPPRTAGEIREAKKRKLLEHGQARIQRQIFENLGWTLVHVGELEMELVNDNSDSGIADRYYSDSPPSQVKKLDFITKKLNSNSINSM
ncbi:hypothetical protein TL16_g00032 [Triparma laevis f. inornata]|uniref:Uncharacterized protein n=1 Tax=Triparma laevis f. inornata TaxID=1714386 RepID=A0A9W6ZBA9_9STRA|nr:hypothetical protein TL16_g00032 [Triparma laevis f. inornata]